MRLEMYQNYKVCFEVGNALDDMITNEISKYDYFKMNKDSYTLCPIAFDIETTLKNEHSYMYVAQLLVGEFIFIFRKWDEVFNAISIIDKNKYSSICWIANMGYEMSFMLKRLYREYENIEIFAKEERHPISIKLNKLLFRDTLSISGESLAKTANDYCSTQKLDTLDYDIERSSKDNITGDEIAYCCNDVIICKEFFEHLINTFVANNKPLPMTQTGIIRNDVKEEYKKIKKQDRMNIALLFPHSKHEYNILMNLLFRGGYTHGNAANVGFELCEYYGENIVCDDYTSSYPAVMLHNKYPMEPFEYVECNEFMDIEEDIAYIYDVIFYNVKSTTAHSLESTNKLIDSINVKVDNGRVHSADEMHVLLTEQDLLNYRLMYTWDKYKILSCRISRKAYLPAYLIKPLLRAYKNKSQLKAEGKSGTSIYMVEKGKVNSTYGMCVQRLNLTESKFNEDGWYTLDSEKDYKEIITEEILSPFWGIWITAYARHNLIEAISKIEAIRPNAVAYCDTDSIYHLDVPAVNAIINEWNEKIINLNKEMHIPFEDIGCFETDPPCHKFKVLGAKRYLKSYYKKGKLCEVATVAGMVKNTFEDYCKRNNLDLYNEFKDNLILNIEDSKKLTSKYYDDEYSDVVNNVYMFEECGVALIKIDFTMRMAPEFNDYIFDTYERRLS